MATESLAIGRYDLLFRQVNERIAEIASGLATTSDDTAFKPFMCECVDADCTQLVPATLGDYRRIRSLPRTFLVLPDHVVAIEHVVERHDGYWVIEKPPELLPESASAATRRPSVGSSDATSGGPA